MFTPPKLGYDFAALEPAIDAKTMEIHYGKHHAGYAKKATAAVAGTKWEGMSTGEILRDSEAMKIPAIRNNVGGHCNHSFFWSAMCPGGNADAGELGAAITEKWGSMDAFKEDFAAAAGGRFGSGWAWLCMKDGVLEIINTEYQDSPLSAGYTRILGLDVWEHAYYLNYQNRRPDYISAWWSIVDWGKANERFTAGGI